MSFAESLTMLEAGRLQQTARATVQSNGRLSFTAEAKRLMGLDDDKAVIVLGAKNGDLGAVVTHRGDERAFELKKVGAYYYLAFKNYLQEENIDYKDQRIIYDITKLGEKLLGSTLYRFARRILPKDSADSGDDEPENASSAENAAEAPSEAPVANDGATTPAAPEEPANAPVEATEGEGQPSGAIEG